MFLARLLLLVYLPLLTALLLMPDPVGKLADWLQLEISTGGPPDIGTHFLVFVVLAVLSHSSRLPLRMATLTGLLVAYGIGVESLQALFPPRTVELKDYAEHLLGLAVGTAVCRLAAKVIRSRRADRE